MDSPIPEQLSAENLAWPSVDDGRIPQVLPVTRLNALHTMITAFRKYLDDAGVAHVSDTEWADFAMRVQVEARALHEMCRTGSVRTLRPRKKGEPKLPPRADAGR